MSIHHYIGAVALAVLAGAAVLVVRLALSGLDSIVVVGTR